MLLRRPRSYGVYEPPSRNIISKMEFRGDGCRRCILEIGTDTARGLRSTACIFGEGPSNEVGVSKPLYGLATARREWYETLKFPLPGKLGGYATLLDKSVFSREKEQFQYAFGRGLRDRRIGNNENANLRTTEKAKCGRYGDFARGRFVNFWIWRF